MQVFKFKLNILSLRITQGVKPFSGGAKNLGALYMIVKNLCPPRIIPEYSTLSVYTKSGKVLCWIKVRVSEYELRFSMCIYAKMMS